MMTEQKHKVKSHNPPGSSEVTISRETHSGPKQPQQAQSQGRLWPYLGSQTILAFQDNLFPSINPWFLSPAPPPLFGKRTLEVILPIIENDDQNN